LKGEAVTVPAKLSHPAWDALLKKYENDRDLVAYGGWKKNPDDLKALDDYLKQFPGIRKRQPTATMQRPR
jgi:hypothetical protein